MKYKILFDRPYLFISEKKLFQVEACKSFSTKDGRKIKKGDRGGFIESEKNLSQKGSCWVFKDSIVYGDSSISGDALIDGNSTIFDSNVSEDAVVNTCTVKSHSTIRGSAFLSNVRSISFSDISENATVSGGMIMDSCTVNRKAVIKSLGREPLCIKETTVTDNATVYSNILNIEKCYIAGNASVGEDIMGNLAGSCGSPCRIYLKDLSITKENDLIIVPAIYPSHDGYMYYFGYKQFLKFSRPEFFCEKSPFCEEKTPSSFTARIEKYSSQFKYGQDVKTVPTIIIDYLKSCDLPNLAMHLLKNLKTELSKFGTIDDSDSAYFRCWAYIQALLTSIVKWGNEDILDRNKETAINNIFKACPASWRDFLNSIFENSEIDIVEENLAGFDDIIFFDKHLINVLMPSNEEIDDITHSLCHKEKAILIPDIEEYLDNVLPF